MRWVLLAFWALLLVLPAAAQEPQGDVLLRVNAPVTIGPTEEVGTAVAINNNARVQGTVRDALLVVNGNATVSGAVGRDVTVINGQLELLPGSRVNNVALVNSTLQQAPGAVISGTTSREQPADWTAPFRVFSVISWIGVTLMLILLGLLAAAVVGQPLRHTAARIREQPGTSVGVALLTWVLLPPVLLALFFSVIGIPVALGLMFIGVPLLALAGYLAAATGLGAAVLRAVKQGTTPVGAAPYREVTTGVLVLQVVGFIPFIGGLLAMLAGFLGSGAVVLGVWGAVRAERAQRRVTRPVATPQGVPA